MLNLKKTIEQIVLLRFYKYIKPLKKQIIIGLLLSSVVSAARAATAYMVKPLLDQVFMAKNERLLLIIPIALFTIFLIQGLSRFFGTYIMESVGEKVIMNVRNDLYEHVQSLSLSYFDKNPSAVLMSRITNDVQVLSRASAELIPGLVRQTLTFIFLLLYIFWLAPFMAMIYLMATPIIVIPFDMIGKRLRKLSKKNQEKIADLSNILQETFQGSKVVKAFGMEEYENMRFAEETEKLYSIKMKGLVAREILSPFMEFLGAIGVSAVIYYSGSQVIEGTLSPGTFFSFLTAVGMLYEPLRRLSKMYGSFQQSSAAAERVMEVFDTEDEIREPEKPMNVCKPIQTISYKDVSFAYDSSENRKEQVLKNISFDVKRGNTLAIVGRSGAGKTTMLDLLPRFYDSIGGSICINSVNIRDVSIKKLREHIGIVTQEAVLFDDTIRNNIAYGMPGIGFDDVKKAAKMAFAEEFIESFPDAYDTVVGEGGGRLSGGQRKRITIARAFLKNPEILLLDEATSELDSESERKVQSAIENLMKNRTTLVIAHRLSTIRNADLIMVMDKGEIVERGTHDELIREESGIYKTLYDMQQHGKQVF